MAAIMVWNYHDEDLQDGGEEIGIHLEGLNTKQATLTEYRIDDKHSNSYEVWKKMGSPQRPTKEQIAELEKAGQLQMVDKPKKIIVTDRTEIKIRLPGQGVSLLKLDW
jgi:xylan 1,4-beta-xylosidase